LYSSSLYYIHHLIALWDYSVVLDIGGAEIITVAIPSYARFAVDMNYFIISFIGLFIFSIISLFRLFHLFQFALWLDPSDTLCTPF